MMEKKEDSVNELETMFPGEVVDIKGFKITMKPLPLEFLPKVMKQFSSIIGMFLKDKDSKNKDNEDEKESMNAKVAMDAISEAIILLPHCMFRDDINGVESSLGIKDVPAYAVPKLMKVFLKQNIPEDMLGEWEALIGDGLKKPVANG